MMRKAITQGVAGVIVRVAGTLQSPFAIRRPYESYATDMYLLQGSRFRFRVWGLGFGVWG